MYDICETSDSNRTEWSPIRSVIVRVIKKITSMITDRIGRHEVLLPVNHKNYNFREKKNSQVSSNIESLFKGKKLSILKKSPI